MFTIEFDSLCDVCFLQFTSGEWLVLDWSWKGWIEEIAEA